MEDPGTSGATGAHSPDLPAVTQPALAPAAIPEEPQGFRRYQTRMGPRAVFFASIHDAATVLLSLGCARILPYYDIPGSAESIGAPVQH